MAVGARAAARKHDADRPARHHTGKAHRIGLAVAVPVEQAVCTRCVQPFLRPCSPALRTRMDQQNVDKFQPLRRRAVFRHQRHGGPRVPACQHPDPVRLTHRQPEPGRIANRRDQDHRVVVLLELIEEGRWLPVALCLVNDGHLLAKLHQRLAQRPGPEAQVDRRRGCNQRVDLRHCRNIALPGPAQPPQDDPDHALQQFRLRLDQPVPASPRQGHHFGIAQRVDRARMRLVFRYAIAVEVHAAKEQSHLPNRLTWPDMAYEFVTGPEGAQCSRNDEKDRIGRFPGEEKGLACRQREPACFPAGRTHRALRYILQQGNHFQIRIGRDLHDPFLARSDWCLKAVHASGLT